MFSPAPGPRLFALPPGADFPQAFVAGLTTRLAALPPEAIARTEIFLNTDRMLRRVRATLSTGNATLHPRLRLVTDIGTGAIIPGLRPAVPPLRRRLELAQLISKLLDQTPDLAPRSATYDLADSLATLMDEMQGEAVTPAQIAALDLTDQSGHWQRSLKFIGIVARYFAPGQPPDTAARQRLAIDHLIAHWASDPPQHPVIVAGSTGSRGATMALMRAVALLPQGAIVLPGYDFDLPAPVWDSLGDAMTDEDHPQFRFRRLLDQFGAAPGSIAHWHPATPPNPPRAALISLSLRPAPVTDQWLDEGPALPDLGGAASGLTLIEAANPRQEALAIALVLRRAAETGTVAALVTPDRTLARQVTAALDRWGILPDDAAGKPLGLSAPGRFLRQVADLFGRQLTAAGLVNLLKHPLTASGSARGEHLNASRDLELHLRRHGAQFPGVTDILAMAEAGHLPQDWADWLAQSLSGIDLAATLSLADHVARHLALAEALATGPGGTPSGMLWDMAAGIAAQRTMADLRAEAGSGAPLGPAAYADLFTSILSRGEVRDTVQTHPRILIWGTLEARVQGADLVILGGLNEGVWPAKPPPDPWMNRQMRLDAGLLLPDRKIGLSAHDYQQAVNAPQVVLSRSHRDTETEMVPSRWLNRLTNLLGGLKPDGEAALAGMRARGAYWLDLAARLDQPAHRLPAQPRPAPRPPVDHRPRKLYVTEITGLIRDPYAIYARHILRLRPLDPLTRLPDARHRGTALHQILEQFIHRWQAETPEQARDRLMSVADEVLAAKSPWPAARRLWRARLERSAEWFLAEEAARDGTPALQEKTGSVALKTLPFTLAARPDRIDILSDGRLRIIDYKSGDPPTAKMQKHFEKQLLLQAAMAAEGGFPGLESRDVAEILYVGLTSQTVQRTLIDRSLTDAIWAELTALIAGYYDRSQGYSSRRAVRNVAFVGDYDHLARYGEWDASTAPTPEDVG